MFSKATQILLAAVCTSVVGAQAANYTLDDVTAAFKANSIVPDVLPSVNFTSFLDLTYGTIEVTPGLNLTKPDTANQPTFTFRTSPAAAADPNTSYVIIGIDPDAPSPTNRSSSDIIHFIGGGFKAQGRDSLILSNTTAAVKDYAGPNPPTTSAAHRYIFLLFHSTALFESQTLVDASTPRSKFDFGKFRDATGLGDPIGGNFFYVSTNTGQTGTATGPAATPTGGAGRIVVPGMLAGFVALIALLANL